MFKLAKKNCLERQDRSRKGSIDKPILSLIKKINSNENFFTTSSCSGRTIVINRCGKNEKLDSEWFYTCHEEPKLKDILASMEKKFKGELWLKFEPFILHVQCKNIESAKLMLDTARESGLKNSGLIAVGKKFIVQIEGTDKVDSLIGKEKILVDKNYIKEALKVIKKKFKKNKEKIKRFYSALPSCEQDYNNYNQNQHEES